MPTIMLEDIKRLRNATQARLQDCKNALEEAAGDQSKAIELLRKRNKVLALKRADRDTAEGAIFTRIDETQKCGVIIALGCETDFVGRERNFLELGQEITQLALIHQPTTLTELLTLPVQNMPLAERIENLSGTFGEKLALLDYGILTAPLVASYVHTGSYIGALVGLNKADGAACWQAAKDMALHIVVSAPVAITEADLDPTLLQKEKAVIASQLQSEKKPAHVLEKIATSKLQKFIAEQVLLTQPYVKDNTQTVTQYLASIAVDLQVLSFKRLSIR